MMIFNTKGEIYIGYSIVSLVNVFHLGIFREVLTSYFIYKDTNLIKNIRERIPKKDFYGLKIRLKTIQIRLKYYIVALLLHPLQAKHL